MTTATWPTPRPRTCCGCTAFDARACYDERRALAEAATFLPGVCLIDLNMPGMDGDELAVRLRERASGSATGAGRGDRDEQRGRADAGSRTRGSTCTWSSPWTRTDLLAVVDRLWRAWEAVDAARSG